jgi:hypothetical protein
MEAWCGEPGEKTAERDLAADPLGLERADNQPSVGDRGDAIPDRRRREIRLRREAPAGRDEEPVGAAPKKSRTSWRSGARPSRERRMTFCSLHDRDAGRHAHGEIGALRIAHRVTFTGLQPQQAGSAVDFDTVDEAARSAGGDRLRSRERRAAERRLRRGARAMSAIH